MNIDTKTVSAALAGMAGAALVAKVKSLMRDAYHDGIVAQMESERRSRRFEGMVG